MDDESLASVPMSRRALVGVWAKILRVAYLLSMASFALPFVVTRSCSTEELTEYTGFDLIADGGNGMLIVLLVAPVLFGLTFLDLNFRPAMRGFVHGARALVAGFTWVLMGISVSLHDMFAGHRALVGMWICGICWVLVYALSLGLAWPENRRMLASSAATGRQARWVALVITVIMLVLSVMGGLDEGEGDLAEGLGAAVGFFFFLLPAGVVCYFAVMGWLARRGGHGLQA